MAIDLTEKQLERLGKWEKKIYDIRKEMDKVCDDIEEEGEYILLTLMR